MFHPLVPIDPVALRTRLNAEERKLADRLSALESRVRKFEDLERPAYESWIRLELGPALTALEELHERIHERRILAHRIDQLVDSEKLHPREALHVALSKDAREFDEIEARRQARREAKRADRREAKKLKKPSSAPSAPGPDLKRNRLVSLFRNLARKLHPDSPQRIRELAPSRALGIWLEVQEAYDSGEYERLLAISSWLGGDTEGAGDRGSTAERIARIRALDRACVRLETDLVRLREHPAWDFENLRGAARRKVRQRAARELDEELAQAQKMMEALDDFIESIGPARAVKGRRSRG